MLRLYNVVRSVVFRGTEMRLSNARLDPESHAETLPASLVSTANMLPPAGIVRGLGPDGYTQPVRAPHRNRIWTVVPVAAAALIFVATIVLDHVLPSEPMVPSSARALAMNNGSGASPSSSDSVLILPPLEPVIWRRVTDRLPLSPLTVASAPQQATLAAPHRNEPVLDSTRPVATMGVESVLEVAQASTNSAAADKPNPSLLVIYGNEYLSRSDVAAARLFYRRAADGGSANGAAALAASYDPVVLEQRASLRGVRPDPEEALRWYWVARKLGDPSATVRVTALIGWLQSAASRGDEKARAILERTSR